MFESKSGKIKLLIATDFSSSARIASQLVQRMLGKMKLELYWLHVISSWWQRWINAELASKEAKQRLATWAHHRDANTIDSNLAVVKGKPEVMIAQQAQLLGVDLVVIGKKKRRKASRYRSATIT